jgi:hypothetical protein
LTVVVTESLLLPGSGFGSPVVLVALAVLVQVPTAAAVTLIVADLLANCARPFPRLQVTVVTPLTVVVVQGPGLADAETNVTPVGSVSVTVIPLAVLGPALYTVIVYCKVAPTNTEPVGDTDLLTVRSAPGLTVVDAVEVRSAESGSAVGLDTTAVFAIDGTAEAVGFTVMVIVTLCPLVIVPRVHDTVAVPLQVPSVVVVDTHVTVVGSVSVTITLAAELGPAFVTVSVYVRFCPASTEPAEAVLVIERSAEGLTVVDAVEVRSAESGSAVGLDTIAVFAIDGTAEAVGVTVMVIVTLCPLVIVPRVHDTVAVPLQVPADGGVTVVDTHVTVVGSVSVTPTLDAELGPLFVTTMVYVRFCPTSTEPAEAVLAIERSAEGLTVVDAVEVRSAESGSAVGLDTVAVLFRVPVAVGVTVSVIVTVPPLTNVPMVHVTVGVANEHVPDDAPAHVADPYVRPLGRLSVTTTPLAVLGPAFDTMIEYAKDCPTSTGLGPVFVIERSAEGLTVVVVVAVLLVEPGKSGTALDTIAVLLSVPSASGSGVTTIVTVALAPLVSVPRLHSTVPPLKVHGSPWLEVADPNVTVGGSWSDTITFVAVLGPAFDTASVYVRFWPTSTGSGASLLVIDRSAPDAEDSSMLLMGTS